MVRLKYLIATSLVLYLSACGKDKNDSETSPVAQLIGALEVHTAVDDQLSDLHITKYGSGNLRLAEETWDKETWGTETRFNCIGTCDGSITAEEYLDRVLDPEQSGPVGGIKSSLSMFCVIGVLLEDEMVDGLPAAMKSKTYSLTSSIKKDLKKSCDIGTDELPDDLDIKIAVKAFEGKAFDRLISLVAVGAGDDGEDMEMSFYLKNSGGLISIGTNSNEASKNNFDRTLLTMDLATKIFRFESYYRNLTDPAEGDSGMVGSFSFYRGFRNADTGEVRFLSNMGSSNYELNSTFVSVNASTEETQAGTYFARTSEEGTALDGAFVCFDRDSGDFINAKGCKENADEDRKSVWGPDSKLFKTVEAKKPSDWTFDENSEVPAFDADTMFTLAPNY